MKRFRCGCNRSFRTGKQFDRHIANKRSELHSQWVGQFSYDGKRHKYIATGGARQLIDAEPENNTTVTGASCRRVQ